MTVRQFSLLVSAGVIQNLRTTNVTQTTIALAWDAYPGATGYEIRRGTPGQLVHTITDGSTTWTNSSYSAGTTYTLRVRPVVGGSGLASAEASIVVTTASAGGNQVVAVSPSQADVAAAIAAANVGDTVQVPAGSGTWTDLAINKAVRIVGAGIGQTNITLGTGNTITKQASGLIRLRGFSFTRSGSGGNSSHGFVIGGAWSARPVVIEECRFDVNSSGLFWPTVTGGVIWAKCSFYGLWDDSFIRPKNTGGFSEWRTASTIGAADTSGERNFYIEDCYFYGGTNQGTDFDDGARAVFRYNRCDYTSFNSHGLATSALGIRHFEIYGNDFRNPGWTGSTAMSDISNQNWAIWIRGGTGVIFNNAVADIANSYWGTGKNEAAFDIRAQADNSGAAYGINAPPVAWTSGGQGNYPRQHQLAVSFDGRAENSGYFIDPIYIWGNTGAGSNASGGFKSMASQYATPSTHWQLNRDYFIGSAKPGYTSYTYPHPLRESTGRAY